MSESKRGNLLKPVNQQSVVDIVKRRITDSIISGQIKPGGKLPTEVEFSENLGVGRNTVREAVKSLEAMGLLIVRRPFGTYVADGLSSAMLEPLVYGLMLEGGNTPSIVELRRLMETGALNLAVQKATKQDVAKVKTALDELGATLKKRGVTRDEIINADYHFHQLLHSIINNPLIDMITVVVERVSRPTIERVITRYMEGDMLEYMYERHEEIYNLLSAGDCGQTSEVMDRHFFYWRDTIMAQPRGTTFEGE